MVLRRAATPHTAGTVAVLGSNRSHHPAL